MAGIEGMFNNFNERLEKPIRDHLKNVYACLAMSTLAAGAGGYVHLFTDFFQAGFLSGLLAFGCLIGLMGVSDTGKNRQTRLGMLLGFAFFSGIGLGPLLELSLHVDPSILPTAMLATGVVFACFSASALLADDRKFLYLGGTLGSGLLLILVMGLANIFFRSYLLFQIHIYLGLFIMCGFILYDTQLIIQKRRRGDTDYIWHSVDLFIDLIGIFRRILIILTDKESNNKNKRK